LRDAARARSVELSIHLVDVPERIVPAIEEAKRAGAMALNVLASPMPHLWRGAIIERAAALRLPAIYQWVESAEEGGLIAYGPRIHQVYRQMARQLAKVLRGAKPRDLPVEQRTAFELVINLKAAAAIGHEIPTGLVQRADAVIEQQ
jgi:putative tryptophan/tyrosine transport system substrate-binding protein